MPFYVSPEQQMKDKADYARKGIARGRNSVVLPVRRGDPVRRAEPLQRAAQGQRDLRPDRVRRGRPVQRVREPARRRGPVRRHPGLPVRRGDVTARGLANWYAQVLGSIFTESNKPYEVEIVVAEVGETADGDQMYRITFDGSVADEHGFVAMGGQAEQVAGVLKERYADGHVDRGRAGRGDRAPVRPGQRRAHRDQRQPARGRGAGARPGSPDVPPDHRARLEELVASATGRSERPSPPARNRARRTPPRPRPGRPGWACTTTQIAWTSASVVFQY